MMTVTVEEEHRDHLLGKCPALSQEWRGTLGKLFLAHDEIIKADPVDVIAFLQRIGRLLANDSAWLQVGQYNNNHNNKDSF